MTQTTAPARVASIARAFAAGRYGEAVLDSLTFRFDEAAIRDEVVDLFEALAEAIEDYAHMAPALAEVEDLLATAKAWALGA